MQSTTLGRTDIQVSRICLGSMTWGSQNTYDEAARQIARALEAGVNFIDTAEMYPTTPFSQETLGVTEEIIGRWNKNTGRRGEVVIATKMLGKGPMNGQVEITGQSLRESVERSLERLQTDCIDVYQLHWPNRGSYHFRQRWDFDATSQPKGTMCEHVRDVLTAASDMVRAGKIRTIGLSNESTWGAAQFLAVAEAEGLPRVVSIQNEYSLLERQYDLDLAELSHHEDVGLLAWSPLAAGMLSGKYENGTLPEGSRRALNESLGGRFSTQGQLATSRYVALARSHGLDPAQMAIAFCLTRPFVASTIIGATRMAQLDNALAAADLTLSREILDGIAAIHRDMPAPL